MKIILRLIILNIFHKVYTQFNNNLYYNQAEPFHSFFNTNNNERNANFIKNHEALFYQTYQQPIEQSHLTIPSTVLNQNAINLNKKHRGTENYQIIQLHETPNPFLQKTQNELNSRDGTQNPNAAYPEGRSLNSIYTDNSNSLGTITPSINIRFNTDEGMEDHNNADLKKISSLHKKENDDQASAETFQYQYNKGWSIHEAVSVDNLIMPHLEERKYSKYSTPNIPEAHYYQKFYDIYNHVEHQTKQDLGDYEMESINEDFNGRSIVAPGQYPHMAAIGFLSNEERIEFKCGGSLISKNFVITAAHCCYLNGETPIIVKLGIINLKFEIGNSEPQRRTINEIIVHPSYNSTMNYHDIALLKLQAPVEFTKFVRPILLWSSDDIPYERVFTMGYGSTSFARAPTNILTELSLSLIPLQKCKEILPRDEKIPDGIVESQICARDLEKNRDTCQGDSGGPLQLNLEHRKQRNTYRYYLVGIISYGEFCGGKKPGIYTRVSSYCRWIASVVWPNFEM